MAPIDDQPSSATSLPGLIRIPSSPYYLYPPPASAPALKTSSTNDPNDPQLILLCSWTDASPKHILKYIHAYRGLYPTSPILLIRTFSSDFFLISRRALRRKLAPAIEVIRAHLELEPHSQSNNGLLAHALSNGGAGHLTCLARQYHEDTGRPFPVNALILDSTPTRARFRSLVGGLSVALPSPAWIYYPLQGVIVALVFLAYVVPRWIGRTNMADRVYHDLNSLGQLEKRDGEVELLSRDAMRTYIYSEEDQLCPAEEIIPHAREAERRGLRVRKEVWVGSGHVAHMKLDPERYWNVVRETWEARNQHLI